jgi:hypothetical protein
MKDLYVARTSEVAGVTREMLVRELQVAPHPRRLPAREADGPPTHPYGFEESDRAPRVRSGERRADHTRRGSRAERELVRMLLHLRHFVDSAAERVGAEMFEDSIYAAIFNELISHDSDAGVDEIALALDDESTEVLQALLNENGGLEHGEETVLGSINALRARGISRELGEIDRRMAVADLSEKDALIAKKQKLSTEMRNLGRPHWKMFGSTGA